MYSAISDKLLHRVVFQVTVATVHLERLVADLRGESAASWVKSHELARLRLQAGGGGCGLTLKHSSVAKSLAMAQRDAASERSSCSAFAASRTSRRDAASLVAISASLNWRNCNGKTERRNSRDMVSRGVQTWQFDSPGCWTACHQTASVPTGDLLRAVCWRAPPPENRRLLVEEESADWWSSS